MPITLRNVAPMRFNADRLDIISNPQGPNVTGAWVDESEQAAADNAALDAAIYGTGMYATTATQANQAATTGTEILRQIERAAETLNRNAAPEPYFAHIPPSFYEELRPPRPWEIRGDTVRLRDGFLANSASTTRRTSSSALYRIDAALTQFRRAGFLPTTIAVSDAVYEEVKREVRPVHVAMPVPVALTPPSEATQYAAMETQSAETLFGVRLVKDSFTRGFQIACEMV